MYGLWYIVFSLAGIIAILWLIGVGIDLVNLIKYKHNIKAGKRASKYLKILDWDTSNYPAIVLTVSIALGVTVFIMSLVCIFDPLVEKEKYEAYKYDIPAIIEKLESGDDSEEVVAKAKEFNEWLRQGTISQKTYGCFSHWVYCDLSIFEEINLSKSKESAAVYEEGNCYEICI